MDVEKLRVLLEKNYNFGVAYDLGTEDGFVGVQEGDWQTKETIVQHIDTGNYYSVIESRTNSGYWNDSEKGDIEVYTVKPVEEIIKVTKWVVIKESNL